MISYIFSKMLSYDSTFYELLFSLLLSMLCLPRLKYLLANANMVDFTDICIFMTTIFFSFGPWICFYYGGTLPNENISILFRAYLSVALFLIGLICSKKWSFGIRSNESLLKIIPIASSRLCFKYLIVSFLIVYSIRYIINVKYGFLFSLTGNLKPDIPYWIYSLGVISNTINYGLILMASSFLIFRELNFFQLSGCLVMMLSEICYSLIQGRRWVLFSFVSIGIVWCIKQKIIKKSIVAWGLVSVIVLSLFVFPFFLKMRTEFQRKASIDTQVNIADNLINSFSAAFQDIGDDSVSAYNKRNMEVRALFQIRWICWILGKIDSGYDLLWGRAMYISIIQALPKIVYPWKNDYLDMELTVAKHFGMPMVDLTGSFSAYGLADFHFAGCLLYGFFIGSIIKILEKITFLFFDRSVVFYYFVCGGIFYFTCMVESSITLLWICVRTFIILWILLVGITYLKINRKIKNPS